MNELTQEEIIQLKKLLGDLKTLNIPLKDFLRTHHHDNQNSVYVKTLNIDGGSEKVFKIGDNYIFAGLGIRLKNSAEGLPNLGDEDLGVAFYDTTYHEVWVWRYNGANNEWKALKWAD
jgi:hypothetical protein